jgi:hypothetical protein
MRRALLRGRVLLVGVLLVAPGVVANVATAPAAHAAGHDDTVYAFGSASFQGSTQNMALDRPVAAMATTASGNGYWIVTKGGAVYSFNAPFYGGLNGFPLAYPVVGMTATPTGKGYWLVTSDGSVFRFGDAKFYGSLTRRPLNSPIKSLIAGPGGKGYWLYAADGGVFSFGSSKFYGSTGGMRLNQPVVGMTSGPGGKGYWLVAKDGGIFSFGSAKFYGSMGSRRLAAPIVGMARTGKGTGYWLAGADGGVFSFGSARFRGSAAGKIPWGRRVVQLVGMPDGNGYRMLALPTTPDVALINMGATGPAVVDVQRRLVNQGYWLPGINGVFDANMRQAVWAFQKANRIPRTGWVDGATQAAFRTASRPRARSTTGYVVEIDKARQIILITANGVVTRVFNTSTGNDIPYFENGQRGDAHTPEGVFTMVTQYNGLQHGPLGTLFRPKYFTWAGHAIHGSPNIPPYPASHGCARVSDAAINWMWANNVLPMGTTVWVY